MLPPIHFFRRPHYQVNNYYCGTPMMFSSINSWYAMMFRAAQPMLIGGLIANFGKNIADIISGSKQSNTQCNCNHNMMYDRYNNSYYNNVMSSNMYPYVNLTNTSQNEGKGGTVDETSNTLSEMKSAYKEHGITSIYKGEDGRYFAITKDGEQLSALNLGDLADEIGNYIKSNSSKKPQNENSENTDTDNENVTVVKDNKETEDETVAEDQQEVTTVKKSKVEVKKDTSKVHENKPKKYTNTTNINYAVDKLHRGIKGDGLATVTPEHITDVLFDKNVFNKDSAVSILASYQQKYGKELFEDIDSEFFYFPSSKTQDYLKIVEMCVKRANETVKDANDKKTIYNFYKKVKSNTYQKSGQTCPLSQNNDMDTFKKVMQILRNAEPKN